MSVFPPLTMAIGSDIVYRHYLGTRISSSAVVTATAIAIKPDRHWQHSVTLNHRKIMPQFWIAIFFIVLAIAQLFQSIKEIELPLPVYLLLGTVLAIASNAPSKLSFSPARSVTRSEINEPEPVLTPTQSPLITATADRNLTPIVPIAIVPKKTRRKTTDKAQQSSS